MQRAPLSIPSWAPAVAVIGLLAWAISIWWMVATLPTDGGTAAIEEGVATIAEELEATRSELDALAAEVAALRAARDDLTERLDALVTSRSMTRPAGALELSTGLEDVEAPDPEAPDGEAAADRGGSSVEASDADTSHPLFTNGADRYNCTHFASYDEAQEALRVNRPGDPNRIDMNDNNIACEDIRFPTPATGGITATDE